MSVIKQKKLGLFQVNNVSKIYLKNWSQVASCTWSDQLQKNALDNLHWEEKNQKAHLGYPPNKQKWRQSTKCINSL